MENTQTQIPYTEKKSKVKSASFKKEWKGREGTMFDHNIEFENGDKGVYQSNQKEQTTFKQGEEVDYSIVSRLRNGFTDIVIKPAFKNRSGGNFKKSYEKNYKADFISFAASYTKDLVVAGKVELKQFRKTFQTMYDVMEGQLNKVNGQNESEKAENKTDEQK